MPNELPQISIFFNVKNFSFDLFGVAMNNYLLLNHDKEVWGWGYSCKCVRFVIYSDHKISI